MLRAIISAEWISGIHEQDVWRFNTESAEFIQSEVTLGHLGSLAVDLASPRIATAELVRNARSVQHIINLAFGEPAIETNTGLLLKASHDTYGIDHELTNQLVARNRPNSSHGADEPWFLPLSGVKVIDTADIKAHSK